MFTGIINHQGVLRQKKKSQSATKLTFEVFSKDLRFQFGASVAVNGVCLTISDLKGKRFSADVIPETLRDTTLGNLEVGERVNMEPSLRMGDPLGGHWVTGHVDGIGVIEEIGRRGQGLNLRIHTPADIISFLVGKGSIAIDGISFTVQEVQKSTFVVGVTPYTYRVTNLRWKHIGDLVNLEVDMFARLVQRFMLGRSALSLKVKDLKHQGF